MFNLCLLTIDMIKYDNVLLIDDDPISNFLTDKALRELNIANQIHISLNGRKAIIFLKEFYLKHKLIPELILLDINMPVMDGFEFLQEFEMEGFEQKIRTRVMMLSNIFREKDIEVLNKLSCEHYLRKPLNKNALMDIVRSQPLCKTA
jgi:CheY-like chemotaxis protein